jgi:hypothetical protein
VADEVLIHVDEAARSVFLDGELRKMGAVGSEVVIHVEQNNRLCAL